MTSCTTRSALIKRLQAERSVAATDFPRVVASTAVFSMNIFLNL